MKAESGVMTGEEAARYLHVRPSTLRAMVREERVPYTRVSERHVVFLREVLDLWLIHETRGPGSRRLRKMAIELRRHAGVPTRVPLSKTEEAMLAASRRDVAKGRTAALAGI